MQIKTVRDHFTRIESLELKRIKISSVGKCVLDRDKIYVSINKKHLLRCIVASGSVGFYNNVVKYSFLCIIIFRYLS